MKPFSTLLDRLSYEPRRTEKLRHIVRYLRDAPDPDRGYALAALCGALDIPAVKPAMLRALVAERVDPVLFGLSYDFVGDLSETIALIWPAPPPLETEPLHLADVIATLLSASRREGPALIAKWLDELDETGRWALLKLITGGLRVGVSALLARQALAEFSGHPWRRSRRSGTESSRPTQIFSRGWRVAESGPTHPPRSPSARRCSRTRSRIRISKR